MEFDYQKLLKAAKEKLPEMKGTGQRFEIPKVTGHVEGNKTIITNFASMVSIFHRDADHLLKYLQRELATPAVIDGPRLVLGRKLSSQLINTKIENYAKDFVLCKECGKPDTKIIKEDRILSLKCTACGAKQPIRSKI